MMQKIMAATPSALLILINNLINKETLSNFTQKNPINC